MGGWGGGARDGKSGGDAQVTVLAAAVAGFEKDFGDITAGEMAAQRRVDRGAATVVRDRRRPAAGKAKSV